MVYIDDIFILFRVHLISYLVSLFDVTDIIRNLIWSVPGHRNQRKLGHNNELNQRYQRYRYGETRIK